MSHGTGLLQEGCRALLLQAAATHCGRWSCQETERKREWDQSKRCSLQHAVLNKLQCLQAMGYCTDSRLHRGLCCHPGTTYWERALHFHEDSQTSHCPIPQTHRHQVKYRSPSANHL